MILFKIFLVCFFLFTASSQAGIIDYIEKVFGLNKKYKLNKINSKTLDIDIWSDFYWPYYRGGLSYRYADPSAYKKNSYAYVAQKNNYRSNSINDYLKEGKANILSPAEKYDLIVGDRELTLSERFWEMGDAYLKNLGKIPIWFGICHGWASASFVVPRPKKAVKVWLADASRLITFYPADIKALISLWWANSNISHEMFIGRRCQEEKVILENNRIKESACFDVKPDILHRFLIEKVGENGETAIVDADYTNAVWNYPIISYNFKYFNVNDKNRELYYDYKKAKVEISDVVDDKFHSVRSEDTKFIVGVELSIKMANENRPNHALIDNGEYDKFKEEKYIYDLELDQDANVIKGEWVENKHPDFIWKHDKESYYDWNNLDNYFKEKSYSKEEIDSILKLKSDKYMRVPNYFILKAPTESWNFMPIKEILIELIRRSRL